jgi:SAM-dependent methyltransferase
MPGNLTRSRDPGPTNRRVWASGRFLGEYTNRQLRPVEVLLMARHRDELNGSVLELGCGAGRIAGYLCELAERCYGIDISAAMIEESRRRYPKGEFIEGDLGDLSQFADGSLDAVWAGCNVLDIFTDRERRDTLQEIRRVLSSGGLLLMSSHNRAYLPNVTGPLELRTSDPLRFAIDLARAPRNFLRDLKLRRLEHKEADYEIVSDGAHGYTLVHYFITAQAQFSQLGQEGFEPLECLDLDGNRLEPGGTAGQSVELHYVARRR